jgi:hypothetical protein
VDVLEPERLKQAQNLDVLPLAGLAHAGLEQAAQGRELVGQPPALERSGLVQRTEFLLEQRQVVQRVEDEVLARVRALVPGDDLGPAGDHHLLDIALHQHRAVAVGGRHRVVVALVAHEGQRGDPCRPAVAGLIGHGWPWPQDGEVPLQPLAGIGTRKLRRA